MVASSITFDILIQDVLKSLICTQFQPSGTGTYTSKYVTLNCSPDFVAHGRLSGPRVMKVKTRVSNNFVNRELLGSPDRLG